MLEAIINPKRAERKPWEMLIIGILYATLSILLVNWVFSGDVVLSRYSGIFMITFTVIFSMPFFYYLIKLEEQKDIEYSGAFRLLKEHSRALLALLFLFMGFIIAFSFWYSYLPNGPDNFRAQIETFCHINSPGDFEQCAVQYGIGGSKITGGSITTDRIMSIFANNIYVMIFTLVFSLIFGAGAIFILAWNASVISAAIGIYTNGNISGIPLGIGRYMLIHGIPEIAAYFIAALAGGILSTAFIKHDTKSDKFWNIVQDSLNLIIIAIAILFIAALMEVFITPILF